MFHAETIVARASADEDYRLMLQAIDRARSAMELVMKAVGMIGGDGAVTVNVDQRKLAIENLARLPEDFIRRCSAGDAEALGQLAAATEAAG